MWNLKIDTNELIYEIETDKQNKFMDTKRYIQGEDKLRVWDQQIKITICKIDKQVSTV